MEVLPSTEGEIAAFVAAFEDGTLPKARWTHAAHVLTGAWYVHALGEAGATDAMRMRVRAYNEAVGGRNTATSWYHETITVFWIKVLALFRDSAGEVSRAEFAHAAATRFGEARRLHERFYAGDVMASERARAEWVEPDRVLALGGAEANL